MTSACSHPEERQERGRGGKSKTLREHGTGYREQKTSRINHSRPIGY